MAESHEYVYKSKSAWFWYDRNKENYLYSCAGWRNGFRQVKHSAEIPQECLHTSVTDDRLRISNQENSVEWFGGLTCDQGVDMGHVWLWTLPLHNDGPLQIGSRRTPRHGYHRAGILWQFRLLARLAERQCSSYMPDLFNGKQVWLRDIACRIDAADLRVRSETRFALSGRMLSTIELFN